METPHEAAARRVPTRAWNEKDEAHRASLHHLTYADKRFNPPAPALWKRLGLVVLCIVLVWGAFSARLALWQGKREASREALKYAREHGEVVIVPADKPSPWTTVPARDEV